MKANEAPEKIFLEWYRIGDKKYRDWCITPKTNNEPVEYTRTDAFIEKAWEWVEDNVLSINQQDKSRLYFEQFKNYMKGE